MKIKYKYNGKEFIEMYGLDESDFANRSMYHAINRFTTMDSFAEKYPWQSPYVHAANNPVNYVDVNGDSINVAEEYRELFNNSLNSVFGDYSKNFSYTATDMLTYNGSTKGMSGNQKAALKGMSKVMDESTITNVVYGKSVQITDNNGNSGIRYASEGSGAITILASESLDLSQNIILIDPSAPTQKTVNKVTYAYYLTPIDPANGDRFIPTAIQTNVNDDLFHEIGHVIYQGQPQNKVINYNNRVRKILNLPKRPYDENHNRNILNTIF